MAETVTLTLTEFLLARIAEDEADAYDVDTQWPSRRVLAECEAKRRIVERCADMSSRFRVVLDAGESVFRFPHEDIPRFLAAVYADHQDFREEWRV
jgi:hypothetical protein